MFTVNIEFVIKKFLNFDFFIMKLYLKLLVAALLSVVTFRISKDIDLICTS